MAKKVNNPHYRDTWYELSGGGGFDMRTKASAKSLKHGTPHTIDLHDLGLEVEKLKYWGCSRLALKLVQQDGYKTL